MKKIVLICCVMIVFFCVFINSDDDIIEVVEKEDRGIFISYIELSKYLKSKSVDESKENINLMIENIKKLGFNIVILQVRSFSDAIYESDIFPWSKVVSTKEGEYPGYDIFKYFLDKAHENEMKLVAWINPYRIRSSEDASDITRSNPAYKYLDTDIVYINDGIYYNPSKEEVTNLIVSGVDELINKYQVDGILFDDYFYPNSDVDINDYNNYLGNNEYITKQEYNLNVISSMIKKVHEVCEKKDIKFGVSPDGNIENNYNKVFADVKKWCSKDGYIDFVMPQIYYGFYNENKAFKKVVEEWEKIVTNDNVELMVALAFYKVGIVDNYAKSGKLEWTLNDDIIMREIIISRNLKNYDGFSLFRYDNLFDESSYTEMTMMEIENMKKVLN